MDMNNYYYGQQQAAGQPYYGNYDPNMFGYNAMGFSQIPTPANQNALTDEEIQILKNARPTSNIVLSIDRNDVLRSMCTHKDKGRDVVMQVSDGSGDVFCPICGARWKPDMKTKEEVEALVTELIDQMQNAKWAGDLPVDLTRELFTLMPLLMKYPDIHEYAMNTFNKYYSARGMYNAADTNIYGMYNSLFGAGVPYRYLHDTECSMRLLGINFDFSTEKSNTPLVFPPERIEDFDFEKLGDTLFFSDAEIFNRPLIIKNASELYPKLSEIKKEYERKKLYCEQRCAALMLALLADIARFDEKDGEVGAEKVINSVIKYLRENYGDDISNSDLGKMFGYHPNYLNRIFIKYTGKSIYRYLQDLRIMQALRMLENTELPVSEIARLSGFRDLPHFSRYFKQKTGFSPKSFRI